jgi:hypothetical protein
MVSETDHIDLVIIAEGGELFGGGDTVIKGSDADVEAGAVCAHEEGEFPIAGVDVDNVRGGV